MGGTADKLGAKGDGASFGNGRTVTDDIVKFKDLK
jgi:hypothetical protein